MKKQITRDLKWRTVKDSLLGVSVLELNYRGVCINIEPRPGYCDRGNYIAQLVSPGPLFIDVADMWPRYYFDLFVAQEECGKFIRKRELLGQFDEKKRPSLPTCKNVKKNTVHRA